MIGDIPGLSNTGIVGLPVLGVPNSGVHRGGVAKCDAPVTQTVHRGL